MFRGERMKELTFDEKMMLMIILEHQKQKDKRALQMWEEAQKRLEGLAKTKALQAVIHYTQEIEEIESIINKIKEVKL